MLPLSIIVALADNHIIGINNQLPWHLPADLKHFKAVTTGKPIIMGRKTWESLGRPLPNRLNIVISRQTDFIADGAEVYPTLEKAIQRANEWATTQQVSEMMLIGGAQLYTMALATNVVDKLYLTRVHLKPEGDAWFPNFDESRWHKVETQSFAAEDDKPAYTIEVWHK
ncbi:dihydrofolate reductase [Entomomonas asaccharolytica]|uniref:Dihydrofolate reductase n=1 Tax=Entomomonas asaccharolytica TaxID=2785331 RepID=A0A974RXK1_9GAMM|nr:dihydrofolate reductase [Entomomonas asaccharolytica]QQP86328.1 dihydrofolate reductase [Entomomonas asaccharolytica]